MEAQKLLILPKLADEDKELAATVQHLFHKNTPIDQLLEAMVIPVLIASDSEGVVQATSVTSEYITAVQGEMIGISTRIRKGAPFASLRIQPIYIPLYSKEDLRTAFGAALRGLQ